MQKQIISQLSPSLAEKVISIDERGLTSADWVVYNNGTKRTRYSSVPTSDITATRPLALRKDGTWFAYGWDLTKNICEVFGPAGYIRTAYTYSPYGSVTATGDVTQPIQWNSEFNDTELALGYYNYRHYSPVDGRWMERDKLNEKDNYHLYILCKNIPTKNSDILGNKTDTSCKYELVIVPVLSKKKIKIKPSVLSKTAQAVAKNYVGDLCRELIYDVLETINTNLSVYNNASNITDHGLMYGALVYAYKCECDKNYKWGIRRISGSGGDVGRDFYNMENVKDFRNDSEKVRKEIKESVKEICCNH